jgi:DNA-binding CsgD family transcriptional regulator
MQPLTGDTQRDTSLAWGGSVTYRRGDLLAVLGVAEQLAAVESIEQLAALLPSVASLVGGACVIYHHSATLTEKEYRQVDVGWAEGGFTPKRLEAFAALAHEHPGIQHQRSAPPGQVAELLVVSQLVGEREWRNSRIYSESQHPLGCDDQCILMLGSDLRDYSAFSIGRPGRPFNESEIAIVDLIRPHLRSAAERAKRSRASYRAIQIMPSPHEVMIETPQLKPSSATAALTPREIEVLFALLDGRSARNAAHQLSISPRTYSTHLNTIYHKLGAACRSEALAATFQFPVTP